MAGVMKKDPKFGQCRLGEKIGVLPLGISIWCFAPVVVDAMGLRKGQVKVVPPSGSPSTREKGTAREAS
eukprot:6476029-Amphidinium_carterae.1